MITLRMKKTLKKKMITFAILTMRMILVFQLKQNIKITFNSEILISLFQNTITKHREIENFIIKICFKII
jgi:hypothetical protein